MTEWERPTQYLLLIYEGDRRFAELTVLDPGVTEN
jgi:hypothetical protein